MFGYFKNMIDVNEQLNTFELMWSSGLVDIQTEGAPGDSITTDIPTEPPDEDQ